VLNRIVLPVAFMTIFSGIALAEDAPAPEAKPARQQPADPAPSQAGPSQHDIDKKAFLRAARAIDAQTWSAAITMLKGIDLDKVEDPDVVTYVDMEMRCATLADALGIPRNADPDHPEKTVDWTQLTATMIATIKDKGIADAVKMLADAKKIHDEIPLYNKLDQDLSEKYGTE